MTHALRRYATYGNITGTLALFVALGGTGYAATRIGTAQIKNGAVTTAKIKDGAVTAAKVKPGSLTGAQFAPGTLLKGDTGAAGAAGAAGAPGAAGTTGPAGATGPSDVYIQNISGGIDTPSSSTTTPVATLSLPAGSFLITSKLYGRSGAAGPHTMLCSLDHGATQIDFTNSGYVDTDAVAHIPLQGSVVLAAPGTVTLTCNSDVVAGFRLYGISLAAVKTANLHVIP
jgi:hypothetical protein